MIEVFKTNVQKDQDAKRIVQELHRHFPGYTVNFDLEDCDKILRIQADDICIEKVSTLLSIQGFQCFVLE